MADDKSKTAPQDASKICLGENYEVKYWTQELEVSEQELRHLIETHGNSVEAVRKALGK